MKHSRLKKDTRFIPIFRERNDYKVKVDEVNAESLSGDSAGKKLSVFVPLWLKKL